ncbi:MAG: hypothetical protein N2491_09765 [Negativicutes bacterium]|nr:hypothetical protein [Negativicutes bacterium]
MMPQNMKSFFLGIVVTLLFGAFIFMAIDQRDLQLNPGASRFNTATISATQPDKSQYPPDTVKIQPLPPLLSLSGNVNFEGKAEFPQKLSGTYARGLIIVNFKASGENAHKSAIRISWADGVVETVLPGAANHVFPAERVARQITVVGYSMRERKIFKDSPRAGTVEWEIRYEPVMAYNNQKANP